MFLLVLLLILISATPLTVEVKVTQKENGCKHVVMTTWRYIENINAEVCGDQGVSFMGRSVKGVVKKDEVLLEEKK